MSRTRRSAKDAGTRFESAVAGYLADQLGGGIERRAKTGARDRGDIAGVRIGDDRCVIECKDYGGRLQLPEWLREAEQERANDGALYGIVVAKRKGVGLSDMGRQYAIMDLETLARICRESY